MRAHVLILALALCGAVALAASDAGSPDAATAGMMQVDEDAVSTAEAPRRLEEAIFRRRRRRRAPPPTPLPTPPPTPAFVGPNSRNKCPAGYYYKKSPPCTPTAGSYYAFCITPPGRCEHCGAGTYQDQNYQTSCKTCTVCTSKQFETRSCTATQNRVCQNLRTCAAHEYESRSPARRLMSASQQEQQSPSAVFSESAPPSRRLGTATHLSDFSSSSEAAQFALTATEEQRQTLLAEVEQEASSNPSMQAMLGRLRARARAGSAVQPSDFSEAVSQKGSGTPTGCCYYDFDERNCNIDPICNCFIHCGVKMPRQAHWRSDTDCCQTGPAAAPSPAPYTRDRTCIAYSNCGKGQYESKPPSGGSDRVCTGCAAGQYKGATGNHACTSCAAGTYQSRTGQHACAACAAGKFQDTAGAASCNAVATCAANEYESKAPTATSNRVCKACPAGRSCDGSSTVSSCAAGHYATAGAGSCTQCGGGRWAPAGSSSCTACAAGTFAAAGSSSASDCTTWSACPAGQGEKTAGTSTSDRVCEPCASGSNWSGTNNGAACAALTTCQSDEWESTAPTASSDRDCSTHLAACPMTPTRQYTFAAPTATSDRVCHNVLQCHASTEYETVAPTQSSNRQCAACPSGHSCDGSATTTACGAGWYAASGVGSCTEWSTCAVGQGESAAGSSSVDRQCSPCVSGSTFSAADSGDVCQPVLTCAGHQYESAAPSASSNRSCAACPAGRSCNGGSATTQCAAGWHAQAGAGMCTECAAGLYSHAGSAQCKRCAAGQYSAAGSGGCSFCAAGSFSGLGAASCSQCARGHFSAAAGAASCAACAAGRVQPQPGRTSCDDCAAGRYQPIVGEAACHACNAGTYSPSAGATTCVDCAAGQFQAATAALSCDSCTPGTFQDLPAQLGCKQCGLGTFTDLSGQTGCAARPCPQNAVGTPSFCHCRHKHYGAVYWVPAAQDWAGTCEPMEGGRKSNLALVDAAAGVSANITFAADTGTLYLSASKCVDPQPLCGFGVPVTHTCKSSQPVVRSVTIGGAGPTSTEIQLHADGVLNFKAATCLSFAGSGAASSTVRSNGGVLFSSDSSSKTASLEVTSTGSFVAHGTTLKVQGHA